jgi:hypothetical protein
MLCVCAGLTYGYLPSWIRWPWVQYESSAGFRFPIIARARFFSFERFEPQPTSAYTQEDTEKEIHDFVHGDSQTFYGYDVLH